MRDYYTTKEVADKLHVNTKTVNRYVESGRLKGYRFQKGGWYRIDKESFDKFYSDTIGKTSLDASNNDKNELARYVPVGVYEKYVMLWNTAMELSKDKRNAVDWIIEFFNRVSSYLESEHVKYIAGTSPSDEGNDLQATVKHVYDEMERQATVSIEVKGNENTTD